MLVTSHTPEALLVFLPVAFFWIPAIISAVAALAGGIASGAGAKAAADSQSADMAKNRELREELARKQYMENTRSRVLQDSMAAGERVQGEHFKRQQLAKASHAERSAGVDGVLEQLARAYLG